MEINNSLRSLNSTKTRYYHLGEDVHISRIVRFRARIDDSENTTLIGIPKEKPEYVVAMILMLAKESFSLESILEAVEHLHGLMKKSYVEKGDNPKDLIVNLQELKDHYSIKNKIQYVSVGEIYIGTRPWETIKLSTHSDVGIKSRTGECDLFMLYAIWFAVHVYKKEQILKLIDEI